MGFASWNLQHVICGLEFEAWIFYLLSGTGPQFGLALFEHPFVTFRQLGLANFHELRPSSSGPASSLNSQKQPEIQARAGRPHIFFEIKSKVNFLYEIESV